MSKLFQLEHEPWWHFLDPVQRELLKQSYYLFAWAQENKDKFHDYSFIVMPAAKAFEGYLKKFLYTIKLLPEKDYREDRFRLGKALNPELEHRFPRECLYNEIGRACAPELAEDLWQAWKRGRNRLFHYFPNEQQVFSLKECKSRLDMLITTISKSYKMCKRE